MAKTTVATKKVEKKVVAPKATKKPVAKKETAKKTEVVKVPKKTATKKEVAPKPAKAFHETKEFKNALKFVSKSTARPVLAGVHVKEDQIIATDSYRMIAIGIDTPKAMVGKQFDKAGREVQGNYPAVDSIMNGAFKKATNEFEIDVKDWLDGHELMNILAKNQTKNCPVTLKADGKEMRLTAQDAERNTGSYLFEAKTKIKNIDIIYNASFMIDILKVFKDLGHKTAKIGFAGSTDIITMQDGNVSMILLPIRK